MTGTMDSSKAETLEADSHASNLSLVLPLAPGLHCVETHVPDPELRVRGGANGVVIAGEDKHLELALRALDELAVDGHHCGDLVVVRVHNVRALGPCTEDGLLGVDGLLHVSAVKVGGGPAVHAWLVVGEVVCERGASAEKELVRGRQRAKKAGAVGVELLASGEHGAGVLHACTKHGALAAASSSVGAHRKIYRVRI